MNITVSGSQYSDGNSVPVLAQTGDCLRHLSQRLRLVQPRAAVTAAGDGSGSGGGGGSSQGSHDSSRGYVVDSPEAWAQRMVFDADIAAAPEGLRAELRPYQMKVRRREGQ